MDLLPPASPRPPSAAGPLGARNDPDPGVVRVWGRYWGGSPEFRRRPAVGTAAAGLGAVLRVLPRVGGGVLSKVGGGLSERILTVS